MAGTFFILKLLYNHLMNMNDLRAMAYGKQQNLGKVENDTKNVKPFIPQTFIKTEKEDEKPAAPKNVKAFVPQKLSKAPENQVQARQPEVKAFKPAAFIKTSEAPVAGKVAPAASSSTSSALSRADKNLDNKKLLDQAASYLKKGGLIKVPGESKSPDGKDSVYRRVAKFLLLIGEDEAAKILPHLNEKQIERIIPEIASIRTVNKDEANVILAEFNELLAQTKSSGGIETAREMLEKAYGKDKADQMLSNAVQFDGEKPFEYLRDFEEERLYLLLKDENVGVQSMVLSFLQPEKAAKVINQMTAEEKREVVMRLAKMEPVSPDIIRRVSQALHEKAENQVVEKAETIDGRNALAQILKKMDFDTESEILGELSANDPDLGEDMKQRLFTYEDVVNADDKIVQSELRNLSDQDIAYLIAGKNDDFCEKILSNISAGRRSEVRAQSDILKPMRKSDVDRITTQFVARLRNEFESGNLIIKNRNEDKFI